MTSVAVSIDADLRHLTTVDGRRLAWRELGERGGAPVIALHGVAASHRQFELAAAAAERANVRLVAMDRPGYGISDLDPDRHLLDAAADVTAVADRLGIDRFGVLGVSAGGPYALAAAHACPVRVGAAAVLSCVGPEQQPRSRAGMLPTAEVLFAAARRRSWLGRLALAPFLALGRRRPTLAVRIRAGGLPPADRRVIARAPVWRYYETEAMHAGPTAARAAGQDIALLARRWPFDPGRIQVPVRLFHGELDHEAPLPQAQHLAAAIPGATLHIERGAGHLSFIDQLPDALSAAAFARPSP